MKTPEQHTEGEAIDRVFGAENRARLLKKYLDANDAITTQDAWRHVYRLLLWIDRTTALAHCYESDKAQPGRAWYERSLAFHDWLATALGLAPAELGDTIDWLFREAIGDLASQVVASRSASYEKQRAPYAGRGFPEPGEDPELVGIIRDMLAPWMDRRPPDHELRKLTRRIHAHLSRDNKRRNLVGEGFEDVIAAVVSRLTDTTRHEIRNGAVLLSSMPPASKPPASVAGRMRCYSRASCISIPRECWRPTGNQAAGPRSKYAPMSKPGDSWTWQRGWRP
jgi:hypothetical protein